MTHQIKITPVHYKEIANERKKFEIRYNDRNYKTGDMVVLKEYLGKENYSGRKIYIKINDIFDISDIIKNYVAFTFKIINIEEEKNDK